MNYLRADRSRASPVSSPDAAPTRLRRRTAGASRGWRPPRISGAACRRTRRGARPCSRRAAWPPPPRRCATSADFPGSKASPPISGTPARPAPQPRRSPRRRDPYAGARHRREHGDLQRRARRAAQAAAESRRRPPRLPAPVDRRVGRSERPFSVPEVRDFRGGATSLGAIAEFSPSSFTLQGERPPVRVSIGLVTGNFFDVMGLAPVLGRLTRPSDDGPAFRGSWCSPTNTGSSVSAAIRASSASRCGSTARPTVIGVVQPAPYYPGSHRRARQHGGHPAPS